MTPARAGAPPPIFHRKRAGPFPPPAATGESQVFGVSGAKYTRTSLRLTTTCVAESSGSGVCAESDTDIAPPTSPSARTALRRTGRRIVDGSVMLII